MHVNIRQRLGELVVQQSGSALHRLAYDPEIIKRIDSRVGKNDPDLPDARLPHPEINEEIMPVAVELALRRLEQQVLRKFRTVLICSRERDREAGVFPIVSSKIPQDQVCLADRVCLQSQCDLRVVLRGNDAAACGALHAHCCSITRCIFRRRLPARTRTPLPRGPVPAGYGNRYLFLRISRLSLCVSQRGKLRRILIGNDDTLRQQLLPMRQILLQELRLRGISLIAKSRRKRQDIFKYPVIRDRGPGLLPVPVVGPLHKAIGYPVHLRLVIGGNHIIPDIPERVQDEPLIEALVAEAELLLHAKPVQEFGDIAVREAEIKVRRGDSVRHAAVPGKIRSGKPVQGLRDALIPRRLRDRGSLVILQRCLKALRVHPVQEVLRKSAPVPVIAVINVRTDTCHAQAERQEPGQVSPGIITAMSMRHLRACKGFTLCASFCPDVGPGRFQPASHKAVQEDQRRAHQDQRSGQPRVIARREVFPVEKPHKFQRCRIGRAQSRKGCRAGNGKIPDLLPQADETPACQQHNSKRPAVNDIRKAVQHVSAERQQQGGNRQCSRCLQLPVSLHDKQHQQHQRRRDCKTQLCVIQRVVLECDQIPQHIPVIFRLIERRKGKLQPGPRIIQELDHDRNQQDCRKPCPGKRCRHEAKYLLPILQERNPLPVPCPHQHIEDREDHLHVEEVEIADPPEENSKNIQAVFPLPECPLRTQKEQRKDNQRDNEVRVPPAEVERDLTEVIRDSRCEDDDIIPLPARSADPACTVFTILNRCFPFPASFAPAAGSTSGSCISRPVKAIEREKQPPEPRTEEEQEMIEINGAPPAEKGRKERQRIPDAVIRERCQHITPVADAERPRRESVPGQQAPDATPEPLPVTGQCPDMLVPPVIVVDHALVLTKERKADQTSNRQINQRVDNAVQDFVFPKPCTLHPLTACGQQTNSV